MVGDVSIQLAGDIAAFLSTHPDYPSWEDLPCEFLELGQTLDGDLVVQAAIDLWDRGDRRLRWAAVTLLRRCPRAFGRVSWRVLEHMGQQMGHWGDVDVFVGLAGPAWQTRQISDQRVFRWARSSNWWLRRAALVCTIFLNRQSVGGTGDVARTLAVTELLVGDRDDMVVKAMSWALRELLAVDRVAVEGFLLKHAGVLAARVKREVSNKMKTGVKTPRCKRKSLEHSEKDAEPSKKW